MLPSDVSDIRFTLPPEGGDTRLLAFLSARFFDSIVIRDIKLIRFENGRLHVAMPTRKAHDHCPECGVRTCVQYRYCPMCGARLGEMLDRAGVEASGRTLLYHDLAFPAHEEARLALTVAVANAYRDAVRGKREDAA